MRLSAYSVSVLPTIGLGNSGVDGPASLAPSILKSSLIFSFLAWCGRLCGFSFNIEVQLDIFSFLALCDVCGPHGARYLWLDFVGSVSLAASG